LFEVKDEEAMRLDNTEVVRTYANEAAANIAASSLESQGIEAYVQKDDCGGAYPSLQMAGGVRLLVMSEDRESAEKVLSEMEAEESGKAEQQEPPEDRKAKKLSSVLMVGLFFLGLAAGYFLLPELVDRSTYTGMEKRDRNEQGKPGRYYHYVNGQLTRVEEDRNYDGKPDAWYKYVAGRLRSSTHDNNFDGDPDVWITYKDGFNYVERVDTDFDGKPDVTIFYVNGMRQREDWHPHDSAIIERRQLYENGVLKEELVDTERKGHFDLKITYDPYGRQVEKTKTWVPY
jgi:predicted Fe-Mo cluster-binding NifX family protein